MPPSLNFRNVSRCLGVAESVYCYNANVLPGYVVQKIAILRTRNRSCPCSSRPVSCYPSFDDARLRASLTENTKLALARSSCDFRRSRNPSWMIFSLSESPKDHLETCDCNFVVEKDRCQFVAVEVLVLRKDLSTSAATGDPATAKRACDRRPRLGMLFWA